MDSKVIVFQDFARRAAKKLEEKKKQNKETLRIKSMDGMEMEIRGLSDAEVNDCMEFSDDPISTDKYTIYMASKTLQEAAKVMVQDGILKAGQEWKITDIFSGAERNFIARRILELSGVTGEAGIEVVKETEEIKNL